MASAQARHSYDKVFEERKVPGACGYSMNKQEKSLRVGSKWAE